MKEHVRSFNLELSPAKCVASVKWKHMRPISLAEELIVGAEVLSLRNKSAKRERKRENLDSNGEKNGPLSNEQKKACGNLRKDQLLRL